jgi:hypothetical protein
MNTTLTYNFNPVLASFVTGLIDYFPPAKVGKSLVETALGGFEASYAEELKSGLTGAKLRLRASVVALNKVARARAMDANSSIQAKKEEIVDDGMTWVDSASTDPVYVNALCDWMGFPAPTRENTYDPVRQSLENPFFGVYQAVRAQLLRTQGVPGLSDDELSPPLWEHQAVETQRELYKEQGEAAWDKSYEGTLPDRFSRS